MTSFTYPRQGRIRKREEFLACYEHGRKFHSAHFILYALARPGEQTRTGIAVTRKAGNAVARNRIKRVLREFFRLNQHFLRGMHIVAVAKKSVGRPGLKEVSCELAPIWRRLAEMGGG